MIATSTILLFHIIFWMCTPMSSWSRFSASTDAQDWIGADGFIVPQQQPEIRGSTRSWSTVYADCFFRNAAVIVSYASTKRAKIACRDWSENQSVEVGKAADPCHVANGFARGYCSFEKNGVGILKGEETH
ncbi:hypothetical protein EDD36DRAFT_105601 [Exophiala viscosa]|uniref:Uncharacterized protein n=1 Tax=Exophiala viscosa TaxID=2486360 RepID=A0AAN6DMN1_9EURO|nr:hypothetical protein EDD36DRAFT_105601 [Exophiala viscosa]